MLEPVGDQGEEEQPGEQASAGGDAPLDSPPELVSVDPPVASQLRNFFALALHQIVQRTGWIFKTESNIMPAVLDALGGAGWLRGCVPLLNRLGLSIPPLLIASRVKAAPRKQRVFLITSLLMAASFLLLAAVWLGGGERSVWAPLLFLCVYTFFSAANGVNQLVIGTLQGKLVPVFWRGRLLLVSNAIGSVSAVLFAWWLLPRWLTATNANFGMIFGFTGVCFALAALAACLLVEPADHYRPEARAARQLFRESLALVRSDANFGRLAIVSALFGASIMLFPHYQALGLREKPGLDRLIGWVIVQNIGVGLFSFPAGPLADARGNRLVLKLLLAGVTLAPPVALALAHGGQFGQRWYFLVFGLVGLTPVTLRTLNNYALEISPPAEHPITLSTLNLCSSLPLFLSPLAGWAIDLFGFEAVFIAISATTAVAWGLTFGLTEPRRAAGRAPADIDAAQESIE